MAFVILSPGASTESRVRTLSVRQLVLGVFALALMTLLIGFGLGYGVGAEEAPPPPPPRIDVDDARESRFLIGRVGELSGRMMRLESEASVLAKRIGLTGDAADETVAAAATSKQASEPAKAGRSDKGAKPAEGGPMIPPMDTAPASVLESPLSEVGDELQSLADDLARLEARFNLLDEMAAHKNVMSMVYPSRVPVVGFRVGSRFGHRRDPINKRRAFHSGLDYAAPRGTPIYASAGGLVIYAAYRGEYGRQVEIDHGNGLVTRYSHASRLRVKPGTVVTPGQHIADVGSTGRSTGPHLHFEVLKDGRFVDPGAYLNAG